MTIITQGFSQEASAGSRSERSSDRKNYEDDNREVIIGKNFMRYSEDDSSVNIRIGNRGLSILESLEDGREIRIRNYEKHESYDESEYNDDNNRSGRVYRRNRFRGNWSGIEFGYNNYTASRSSHLIPDEIGYMTLHSGKSHNLNLNFAQISMGVTRHIGFVTGLGLNWNNYRFDGNNNIQKGVNGVVEILNPGAGLEKSKLTTLYAHVPFLLELQLPVRADHFNISAGPIGAVKIASHSKMVFEDKNKIKSNSDFNLNMLRYGATARLGYSNLQIYGTWYYTPMFREGKSPGGFDIYPFEVGVALTFNN